jgi:hypothetical protein
LTDELTGRCSQIASCYCGQCDLDWEVEHKPAETIQPSAVDDLELTTADAS